MELKSIRNSLSLHLLTFVCVDSLQVHDVADDVILICYAVSSQHVSGLPGDVEGFTTAVPLQHGYHLWGRSVIKKTRTYLFCSRVSYARCQPLSSRLKHWKSLKSLVILASGVLCV